MATKPLTVEDLYQQYAGRASDPGGLAYWTKSFGDTIDPSEITSFQGAVAAARAQGTEPAAQPVAQPAYFQANPDVAAAYANRANDPNLASTVNMTPEQFATTHYQKYGAGEQRTSPVIAQAAPAMPQAYDQAYVNQLVREAAAQAGGTLSYADLSNAAKNLGISPEMVNLSMSTGVVTGAPAPQTVEGLYQQYAGRASDPEGLAFWTAGFGDTIEPGEVDAFKYAVAEARSKGTEAPAGTTPATPAPAPATPAPAPDYEQMVRDAYAGIGRTGIGDQAANIDQAGYDNWVNALKTGAVNPNDLSKTFKAAVADYLVANPTDKYSTYVTDYLQENKNPVIAQAAPAMPANYDQAYVDQLVREAAAQAGGTLSYTDLSNAAKNLGISPDMVNRAMSTGVVTGAPAASLTVEDLYKQYAGRAPDDDGKRFWTEAFLGKGPNDTITADEIGSFQRAVAENVAKGVESTATGTNYNAYFAANPDVAAQYMRGTRSMTPDQFAAAHYQNHGSSEGRAAPTYTQEQVNQLVREAAAQAGGTISYNDAVTAARNYGISPEMLNQAVSTGVITGSAPNYVNQYTAELEQLYKDVLGREADAEGLGNWYKQFGMEISPEERAQFKTSAQKELDSRVQGLYTDFLGRKADEEGAKFWQQQFGSSIDDAEREKFRQSAAAEINKQFGANADTPAYFNQNPDVAAAYTKESGLTPQQFAEQHYAMHGSKEGRPDLATSGILSGFKYIKDSGIDEDKLKKTLGEDVFNTYKTGFADYAKTGIANILADKKLSFDEASTAVKFGRDYGYDSQALASLTGQNKELFDLINNTYDDTTNKIVDSVLGAEDVKTDGDRVARSLALQQKYGFTDEDLAKAADYDVKKLKADLDPARNFTTTYKDTISKPDVSGGDILKFLEDSKNNEGIGKLYGSDIDTQIARLNELNAKWKDYAVDGYQAENIYNQISQINTAAGGQTWTGSWMGGGEHAAKEATALLMRRGVDNLSDLGTEKNYEKTSIDQEFYNGQRVYQTEDGSKYTLKSVSYGGDNVGTEADFLPPDAKTTPGKVVMVYSGGWDDVSSTTTFEPLTADELKTYDPKTGKFDKEIGNKLIDKSTGKVIGTSDGNNFLIDRYDTGNFFKGKDKSMGIMMTDQGVPVPYQTTEREGLVYSPVLPLILAALAPGASSMISGALPGAGVAAAGAAELGFTAAVAPTLANAALTGAIMGGGTAALTGQDPLKGALLGGIGAPISAGLKSLLPADLDPALARSITGAGTNIAKGVLQGGEFEDLLKSGVLGVASNYSIGEVAKELNLTPAQLDFAAGIVTPLVQGKDIKPEDLFGLLVKAAKTAPPASQGANTAQVLADSGLSEDEVNLPSGIQTASTDGGFPVRAEVSGTPIFAEDPRSKDIRPPAGYTLVSNKDPSSDEPARYDDNDRLLPKSDGSYYDITQNAWFKPSGEFDLSGVPDYSDLFGGDKTNLTDADLANIGGTDSGSGLGTDITYDDLLGLIGDTKPSGQPPSAQDITKPINSVPQGDAGTIEIVGERPVVDDAGTIEIVGERPTPDDAGTIEIVGERPVVNDAGEVVITDTRPVTPPAVTPPAVVTPPPVVKPPAVVTPPKVTPPKVTPKQVAKMLGVPASSPIVQDVIEALYGTMEYLDIGEEFEPSKRKAKPAATQKQLQQTKMAQGGYLDDLLAENTSVDDLLNLLR